jgi:hypothetical protein
LCLCTSWVHVWCPHTGCARRPWVTSHVVEWQESNKNECSYENVLKKKESTNARKMNTECRHLLTLFQGFRFLHSVAIHKLVRFHGRCERRRHNISFLIAHVQKLQLVIGRIVSLLVFLCFFVNSRKGGLEKLLLQLLEQCSIICKFLVEPCSVPMLP